MIGKIKEVGNDLMFHAITHGNIHDMIALIVDKEVDVTRDKCKNINGQTALHVRLSLTNFCSTLSRQKMRP
jgi:hypothetical protein